MYNKTWTYSTKKYTNNINKTQIWYKNERWDEILKASNSSSVNSVALRKKEKSNRSVLTGTLNIPSCVLLLTPLWKELYIFNRSCLIISHPRNKVTRINTHFFSISNFGLFAQIYVCSFAFGQTPKLFCMSAIWGTVTEKVYWYL